MHWSSLERALGATVIGRHSVSGGDICQAYRVELADGRKVFVKTKAGAEPNFFPCEARGLAWLGQTGALKVPEVLAVESGFLALEWIDTGSPCSDFEHQLGLGLARLHRQGAPNSGAPNWGAPDPNFIGTLPQSNRPRPTWAEFWVEERLRPMLAHARQPAWEPRFERLFQQLHDLLPEAAPARLHGDLWRGNIMVGPLGQPVLVDPSCYGGHAEVDLAMLALFGGCSPELLDAYQQIQPLTSGWQQRRLIYQLYPLLVHVVLFAGSYRSSLERTLERLGV